MIPRPLYKILPLAYIGIGIYTIIKFQNTLGALSGIILVAAGVLVLLWRLAARGSRRRRERINDEHSLRRSMDGYR